MNDLKLSRLERTHGLTYMSISWSQSNILRNIWLKVVNISPLNIFHKILWHKWRYCDNKAIFQELFKLKFVIYAAFGRSFFKCFSNITRNIYVQSCHTICVQFVRKRVNPLIHSYLCRLEPRTILTILVIFLRSEHFMEKIWMRNVEQNSTHKTSSNILRIYAQFQSYIQK